MLDLQIAHQLGGALDRIKELSSKTIIVKEEENELNAQRAFVATELPKHANELLASWFTIKNEYGPLISALSNVVVRVGNTISRSNAENK